MLHANHHSDTSSACISNHRVHRHMHGDTAHRNQTSEAKLKHEVKMKTKMAIMRFTGSATSWSHAIEDLRQRIHVYQDKMKSCLDSWRRQRQPVSKPVSFSEWTTAERFSSLRWTGEPVSQGNKSVLLPNLEWLNWERQSTDINWSTWLKNTHPVESPPESIHEG